MTAKPEEIVWFESTISENVEPEVSFVEQEKEEVLVSCTWYCSSLDLEEVKHHDSYVGKRVKRGLFRTRDGILLNADINGAYNIMRKVKGDAAMPPYRGFGYNPVKKFINK